MIEYIDEAHLYLLDGVIIPSVTQLLEKVFPDKYKGIPKEILERKANYGSKVHSMIERIEKGRETGLDDEIVIDIDSVSMAIAYDEYLELRTNNNIEVVSQEEIVHYKNLYAGRYDMIAKVNGELSLVDIKTTAKLDKEYLSWQLSLYELAIGKKFDKLYCIWLPKNNSGKLVEIERKEINEIEKMLGE
jgi:hypothetical protein